MEARVEPQEKGAPDRPTGEIEGSGRFRLDSDPELALRIGSAGQVHRGEEGGARRFHDLDGPPVLALEAGAERLVPARQLAQGPLEGRHVELASEPQGGRDGEGGASRLEPVQEPHALLLKRDGGAIATPGARNPRRRDAAPAQGRGQNRCEAADGGGVEQGAKRDVDPGKAAQARDCPGREQAVAAQIEEMGIAAETARAERLLERVGDQGLQRREVRDGRPCLGLRIGERPAVHLAAGGERECLDLDEEGGNQVFRKRIRQFVPQRPPAAAPAFLRHDVGHQPRARAGQRPRLHHRGSNSRAPGEGHLDLSRLDPVAAHLDLAVATAQELQASVGEHASQISRPVKPRAGREGVGDEPLGGEVAAGQVSAGQDLASQVDLARHSDGSRLEPRVQDVGARVPDGATDGGQLRPPAGVSLEALGRRHMGLGRPVVVVEHGAGEAPEEAADRIRDPQRLSRCDHFAQAEGRRAFLGGLGQALEGDEGQEQPFHTLAGQDAEELRRVPPIGLRDENQRAALGEGGEDFLERGVERQGRVLERAPERERGGALALPRGQVDERALRHGDSLRPPRGSRRVDHVGEIAGGRLEARPGAVDAGEDLRFAVEEHGLPRRHRQSPDEGAGGNESREAGVFDHPREPFGRIGRIERDDGGTGLERCDHGRDEVDAPLQADTDAVAPADAATGQKASQPVRADVQLGVGKVAAGGA